ncbi:response regulator [Exiguobacterium sp. s140]|uniref:response regulator n=1 Tax=Exiguobacterium sp. s140 TaxID=2751290 RepID=UPI001BE99D5D|nr:response regulator [Exiguobacterium sp. s140]
MARVLVVDDAAFMRMMLRGIFEKEGHEVVGEGVNGADGIEKYDGLLPDLVTMDITMPEMDGIRAVEEIVRRHPEAKVIMCSAMGQQAMVIDSIRAGAKDFLVKPFNAEKVMETVGKYI